MAQPDSAASASVPDPDHVLTLGKGVSLALGTDTLIIKDKDLARRHRNRRCGIPVGLPPTEITLPYYNIIWAFVGEKIVIEYAAEDSLECETLQYALAETPEATARAWIEILLQNAYGRAQRQRRAKVLINPHAGPGGAVRSWERDVQPIFEAARMTLDVVVTRRGGEGTEICQALDVDAYDIIVICSGDGLVYEAFNGLGKRADARSALQKVAIAHIPCGSGNAMSCNLNGSYHPRPSALAVVKGIRTSVDLMSVTQGSQRMLSFLSQSVGIIAESDLGTENYRWMGAKRFDFGVVQRIFTKKVYPCDIAIKVEIEDKDQIRSHYKRMRTGGEQSYKTEGGESTASVITADSKPDSGEGLPPLRFGTVKDKLPDDWQTASYDRLGNFYCGNMAWMAPDVNFFPAACMNDGLMDVITNDGDLSAFKYFDLMTSIDSDQFFDKPLLTYRKVVAYRFTPRNQANGYISIDGERVPFEPFQVEIHPGLGVVISKSGRYEAYGPRDWEKSV